MILHPFKYGKGTLWLGKPIQVNSVGVPTVINDRLIYKESGVTQERIIRAQSLNLFVHPSIPYVDTKPPTSFTYKHLYEVMNLGMIHRQDQLNSQSSMSGNDVLIEYVESLISETPITIKTSIERLVDGIWKEYLLPSEWDSDLEQREVPFTYQKYVGDNLQSFLEIEEK